MAFSEPFYRWRPHPRHGIDVGSRAPRGIAPHLEITPRDLVKCEAVVADHDEELGGLG